MDDVEVSWQKRLDEARKEMEVSETFAQSARSVSQVNQSFKQSDFLFIYVMKQSISADWLAVNRLLVHSYVIFQ